MSSLQIHLLDAAVHTHSALDADDIIQAWRHEAFYCFIFLWDWRVFWCQALLTFLRILGSAPS